MMKLMEQLDPEKIEALRRETGLSFVMFALQMGADSDHLRRQFNDRRSCKCHPATAKRYADKISALLGRAINVSDITRGFHRISSDILVANVVEQLPSLRSPDHSAMRLVNNSYATDISQIPTLALKDRSGDFKLTSREQREMHRRGDPIRILIPPYQITSAVLFRYLMETGHNIEIDFGRITSTRILQELRGNAEAEFDMFVGAGVHMPDLYSGPLRKSKYRILTPLHPVRQRLLAPLQHSQRQHEFYFLFDNTGGRSGESSIRTTPEAHYWQIKNRRKAPTGTQMCALPAAIELLQQCNPSTRLITWEPLCSILDDLGVATPVDHYFGVDFSFDAVLYAHRRFMGSPKRLTSQGKNLIKAVNSAWKTLNDRKPLLIKTIRGLLRDPDYRDALTSTLSMGPDSLSL